MATGIEAMILEGLIKHLANRSQYSSLPEAWPNRPFTPVSTGYLRCNHLPNTTRQVELGDNGRNRHIGLFQVDVVWPQGTGSLVPMEVASAIIDRFARGTSFTQDTVTVRIIQPPSVAPALQEDPYIVFPVTIPYQADAANP